MNHTSKKRRLLLSEHLSDAILILKGYGVLPIVLWNVFMTKVDIQTGEILVNTVELSQLMNTHRPSVSKAIKLLRELGLVAQVRKDGKHFVYKINDSIMWKSAI